MTYNLILDNKKKTQTPNNIKSDNELIQNLRDYFTIDPVIQEPMPIKKVPKKFIYLLDHSYTQKGLSWSHLKNTGILRANALRNTADALDLEIYLALADIQETWSCEENTANISIG